MSIVTKVLQDAAGIQYQGVQDKSEADPSANSLNALFIGQFKRGRLDKPFLVTKENIRAKLGFDVNNKDYQAVEDTLKIFPFIWVQRYFEGPANGGEQLSVGPVFDIKYKVNGEWIYETTGPIVTQVLERSTAYANLATEIVINDTVTTINQMAFRSWKKVTHLTLSQNLKTIGQYAFEELTSLIEIIIPDSVESIGTHAFGYGIALQKIVIGKGVKTILSNAFTQSLTLKAAIFTGPTPPTTLDYQWLIQSGGANGYTTGVIFVPDAGYNVYLAVIPDRLYPMSQLATMFPQLV